MKNQIPNLLTLSRIIVIPALVASFYIDGPVGNWIGFALFAFAGVTDFFDGYLARSMNVVSPFGRFLDPIADKLLVAAALMMMVAFERIAGLAVLPAVVIMCREIMVSGLREVSAAHVPGLARSLGPRPGLGRNDPAPLTGSPR